MASQYTTIEFILLIGLISTAVGDVWQQGLGKLLGKPTADWALVGRWTKAMIAGRFTHESPSAIPQGSSDTMVGWFIHYIVGIAYVAIYLAIIQLLQMQPSLSSAIIYGIITLAAPFLWMKPSMGLGWFGSKVPNFKFSVFVTTTTHIAFGIGIYLAWILVSR